METSLEKQADRRNQACTMQGHCRKWSLEKASYIRAAMRLSTLKCSQQAWIRALVDRQEDESASQCMLCTALDCKACIACKNTCFPSRHGATTRAIEATGPWPWRAGSNGDRQVLFKVRRSGFLVTEMCCVDRTEHRPPGMDGLA